MRFNPVLLCALLTALLIPMTAVGEPCAIPIQDLSGGEPGDLAFDGRYAFVANPAGIEVVDSQAEGGPARVASVPILGVRRLILRNQALFVVGLLFPASAADGVELFILDVQDPLHPKQLSRLVIDDYFFAPNSFDIEGNLLLLGLPRRADLIDISDLTAPVRVGIFDDLPQYATITDVELMGDYAAIFLPYEDKMLSVLVADPTQPVVVGEVHLPDAEFNPVWSDSASEGSLLLAALQDRIYAISMENPLDPQLLSVVQVDAWDLALQNSRAFVLSRDLTILDYTDPTNPQAVATCCPAAVYESSSQIAINADRGFMVEPRSMRTIDFSTVEAPLEGESLPRFYHPTAIAADGGFAFVSQWSSAAHFVPLDGNPRLRSAGAVTFTDGSGNGPAEKIAFQGPRALVARGAFANVHNRLYGIDAADPAAPVIATMREFAGALGAVRLRGETAFACTGAAGASQPTLWSLDAADLSAGLPTISSLETTPLVNFEIEGDALYAVSASGALQIFNIADPSAMTLESTLPGVLAPSAEPIDIELQGARAYVIDRVGRLSILDLPSPWSASVLSTTTLFTESGNKYVTDLEADGDKLYITVVIGFQARFTAFDVSNPLEPSRLAWRLLPPWVDYPLVIRPTGIIVGAGGLLHSDLVTCPCPADLNGDGSVDFADLNLVINAFNTTPGHPNFNPDADANHDNAVDFADLNVILAAFNDPC